MKRLVIVCGFVALVSGLHGASATQVWETFVIREGVGGAPVIQARNDVAPGTIEFLITGSSQKAGWGTQAANGFRIGDLHSIFINRLDDVSRFSAGSGPAVAPYFNIWITDGVGNYAVIANEPSNTSEYQPGDNQWDIETPEELATKTLKIYETPGWNTGTSWVHDYLAAVHPGYNPNAITFALLADLTVAPPSAAYITNPANGVGSGAPDVLGTNLAYGFTWVFGDTLSNYVSGQEGYIVADPNVVPEPATVALLSGGAMALARLRRRNLL